MALGGKTGSQQLKSHPKALECQPPLIGVESKGLFLTPWTPYGDHSTTRASTKWILVGNKRENNPCVISVYSIFPYSLLRTRKSKGPVQELSSLGTSLLSPVHQGEWGSEYRYHL